MGHLRPLILQLLLGFLSGYSSSLCAGISPIFKDSGPGISSQDIGQADLIIVAMLEKGKEGFYEAEKPGKVLENGASISCKIFQTRVKVLNVFHGSAGNEVEVIFYVPDAIEKWNDWVVAIGRPVLLLLKKETSGEGYELVHQPNSWLTLSDDVLPPKLPAHTDEYIKQLITKILSAGYPPLGQELSNEITMTKGDSNIVKEFYAQESRKGIMQALGTVSRLHLDSPDIRDSIRKLWQFDNPTIRFAAVKASLDLNDSSVINYCFKTWKDSPPGSALRINIQGALADGLSHMQAQDPDAFKPFLESEIPDVRSEALSILEKKKNPTYLPLFIGYLNDPDPTVKYHAMFGIFDLDPDLFEDEGLPVPLLERFKTQPDFYAATWQKWLAQGGLTKLQVALHMN